MTSQCPSPAELRRLLGRAVATPLALLGALAGAFVVLTLYLLSAARWVDHTDRVIAQSNALLKLLVDGETGMRGYVITKDPVFLEPYHAEETQDEQLFDDLTVLVSDHPAQVARLDKLRRDHNDWQEYARQIIALRRDGGDYMGPIRRYEGKRRMDALRGQIAEFIAIEERLREERVRTTNRVTWAVVASGTGLALLLGAVLAVLTRRQLRLVSTSYRTALTSTEERAESLKRSAHRLETLHGIDRAILAEKPMPDLTRSALDRVGEVVPAREVFVVAFGGDGRPASILPHTAPVTGALDGIDTLAPFGRHETQLIADLGAVTRSPVQERLFRSGLRSYLESPLEADNEQFGVLVVTAPEPGTFTPEHREIADEVARQLAIAIRQERMREQLRRHAEELERKVEERTRELQESLRNVKQLQGMLPICAWCKRVRDDGNYWHQVESYITTHTDVKFTHGMCPNCFKSLTDKYPGAE